MGVIDVHFVFLKSKECLIDAILPKPALFPRTGGVKDLLALCTFRKSSRVLSPISYNTLTNLKLTGFLRGTIPYWI